MTRFVDNVLMGLSDTSLSWCSAVMGHGEVSAPCVGDFRAELSYYISIQATRRPTMPN